MNTNVTRLTVFFEEPFWVGIFERISQGKLSVCKITFGAEPKEPELYDFILTNYYRLRFSQTVEVSMKESRPNPKRMQRLVRRKMQDTGVGTKSQQALKSQQEQNGIERKTVSREQREAKKEVLFQIKQEKRKEKHKGR